MEQQQSADKFPLGALANAPVEFARNIINSAIECTEVNIDWLRELSAQPVEMARAILQSACVLYEVHSGNQTEASDQVD